MQTHILFRQWGMFFISASAIPRRKDRLLSLCARASNVEEPSGLCCPESNAGVWDLTLPILGVFQMPFSFWWLFWVPFEEGQ